MALRYEYSVKSMAADSLVALARGTGRCEGVCPVGQLHIRLPVHNGGGHLDVD